MRVLFTAGILILHYCSFSQNRIIVFQSDFGLKDGAVSAMKGVAASISPDLKLYDLTHEIPAYNIWEAAYRLEQTVAFWPAGTVFVSVVDPGVGTNRRSVVAKTRSGHFIVTPDNGTLTLIAESAGIEALREIDEEINRRKNSGESYTFHGRDVYAYTAARLASGMIKFEDVGKELSPEILKIDYRKASLENETLTGTIPILDIQYGNVWTNISADLIHQLNIKPGDMLKVSILKNNSQVYSGKIPFQNTFGAVTAGKPLAYLNSLSHLAFALNKQNFAKKYNISSGNEWTVQVTAVK